MIEDLKVPVYNFDKLKLWVKGVEIIINFLLKNIINLFLYKNIKFKIILLGTYNGIAETWRRS